jgi:hypothetical protein
VALPFSVEVAAAVALKKPVVFRVAMAAATKDRLIVTAFGA